MAAVYVSSASKTKRKFTFETHSQPACTTATATTSVLIYSLINYRDKTGARALQTEILFSAISSLNRHRKYIVQNGEISGGFRRACNKLHTELYSLNFFLHITVQNHNFVVSSVLFFSAVF